MTIRYQRYACTFREFQDEVDRTPWQVGEGMELAFDWHPGENTSIECGIAAWGIVHSFMTWRFAPAAREHGFQ
jgi:hypothetical protein